MRFVIASDHNGIELKHHLVSWLVAAGHVVDDHGVEDREPVDYPPLCAELCRQIQRGAADRGIVVGGTGSGEAMACNKRHGIRATLCQDPVTAEISRANNDANVLVLGAKLVGPRRAEEILSLWTTTPFKGGVHARRIEMLAALERGEEL